MDKFVIEPCKECGYNVTNKRSLGNHLVRTHKPMMMKDYYVKHYHGGSEPLCVCGCGEKTNWHKTKSMFNDFVTGHNPPSYDISKHKHTTEQIAYRNSKIKEVYDDPTKREIILEKISDAVRTVNQTDEYKENHHKGLERAWDNESRRTKMAELSKERWSDPDHYDKVFTEEMRRKVSEANCKRGSNRTSDEEIAFVEVLKGIFGSDDILHKTYINSKKYRSAEFDVYIRSLRLYVEYDGNWEHGFLVHPIKGLYPRQIHNMKNDIRKNDMIIEANKELYRVRSDSSWKTIKSLQELIDISYLHIRDGIIHEK